MALDKRKVLNPSEYNIYDKGYRSGAQSSIFIGPIWVEEAVSIQVNTGSNDQPVYPYSSPYFHRIMLGNYLVSGTIGVAFTEPDYLLRIIQLVREETLNVDDLKDIIERRKNVFANTLKYKLLTEKVLSEGAIKAEDLSGERTLTGYIYNYVDRITREIETSSYSGGGLNPMNFDLTVIKGNIYDETQAIEMYESVKINGTASMVVNDDSSMIELYSFTGRKKPDREKRTKIPAPDGYLSISNLMQMAKEVTEQLVDRILEPPAIKVVENHRRTTLMSDTGMLSIAGLLNENSRFYGREARFGEIAYTLQYDRQFGTYPEGRTDLRIESKTKLEVYRGGKKVLPLEGPKYHGVRLVPPTDEETTAFSNSYGRIISPDRASTADKISAVAAVVPTALFEPKGGSIIMPRYRRNEFDVGSFYPPSILDEKTSLSYRDSEVPSYTATTLWCCLTGFRNTASTASIASESAATKGRELFISEVSQPVFTFGYIERVRAVWEEKGGQPNDYCIGIAEPVYIDYKSLEMSALPNPSKGDSKKAKAAGLITTRRSDKAFSLSKYENDIVWSLHTGGDPFGQNAHRVEKEGTLEIPEELVGDIHAEMIVKHDEIDLEKVYEPEQEGLPSQWKASTVYAIDVIVRVDQRAYKCITAHTSGTTFSEDESKWESLGVWMDPHFFEVSKTLHSSRLITDFNKCLYLRPFLYISGWKAITNIRQEDVDGSPKWLANVVEEVVPTDPAEALAYFLSGGTTGSKRRAGTDDSCDFDFDYNWGVSSAAGYTTYGQAIKINGVYFVKPKDNEFYDDKLTAVDGTKVPRGEIYRRDNPSVSIAGRTIHVFWLTAVMPMKKQGNEDKDRDKRGVEGPIKVFHDLDIPCGRYLEVYNITRCDVMYIDEEKWYNYNPENSTWQAIKNAITKAFEGLINVFTSTTYTWPIKKSMDRIAGYLRGYGCRININEIAEQVLKCKFHGEKGVPDYVNNSALVKMYFKDEVSGVDWTLEKAIRIALAEKDLMKTYPEYMSKSSFTPEMEKAIEKKTKRDTPSHALKEALSADVYTELASMIRETIKEKTKRAGMKVLEESSSQGYIKIYRDVMTPAPAVVTWAVGSDEGYKDLLEISRIAAGGTGAEIELGGYFSE